MSLFGWSLPPGCSSSDIDRAAGVDGACDICHGPVDDCSCEECPACGDVGDIECYEGGKCGGFEAPAPDHSECKICHPAPVFCPEHGEHSPDGPCYKCEEEAQLREEAAWDAHLASLPVPDDFDPAAAACADFAFDAYREARGRR